MMKIPPQGESTIMIHYSLFTIHYKKSRNAETLLLLLFKVLEFLLDYALFRRSSKAASWLFSSAGSLSPNLA